MDAELANESVRTIPDDQSQRQWPRFGHGEEDRGRPRREHSRAERAGTRDEVHDPVAGDRFVIRSSHAAQSPMPRMPRPLEFQRVLRVRIVDDRNSPRLPVNFAMQPAASRGCRECGPSPRASASTGQVTLAYSPRKKRSKRKLLKRNRAVACAEAEAIFAR